MSAQASGRMDHNPHLGTVSTPLVYKGWQEALSTHTDQTFAQYLLRGISNGFRIGFNRSHKLHSATKNMQSAVDHPEVVSQYLAEEIAAGRLLGPFFREMAYSASWHVSRFGVIPKHSKPGHWRLIVDLSFPVDASVTMGSIRHYAPSRMHE